LAGRCPRPGPGHHAGREEVTIQASRERKRPEKEPPTLTLPARRADLTRIHMSAHPHGENGHEHPQLSLVRKYPFSTDHKIIASQFLSSGMIFLVIGGALALMVRIQIAWPNQHIPILSTLFPDSWGHKMAPEFYNMLFSMHATVMIFFVIIP